MENTETQETRKTIYDANASQRFAFEVIENGEKFDSAHRLKPITDERYLGFVEAVDLTGDEAEVTKQANEAAIALWNDLIIEVENFEIEENQEIKDAIASDEKIAIITKFLAVAVVEPEKKAGGVRKAVRADRQTITTEMYFVDEPVKQKHVLQATSDEWRKKYDRIKSRRFKQEKTTGLSRKPKIEYFPQDEAFGNLYDEMLIECADFQNGNMPLRVKTAVLTSVFASRFDEKKS